MHLYYQQKFPLVGTWWIPGKEEDACNGTITYLNEKFFIELTGDLGLKLAPHSDKFKTTLHGISESGEKVTIFDAFSLLIGGAKSVDESISFFTTNFIKMGFQSGFFGDHIDEKSKFQVRSVNMRSKFLDAWAFQDSFNVACLTSEYNDAYMVSTKKLPVHTGTFKEAIVKMRHEVFCFQDPFKLSLVGRQTISLDFEVLKSIDELISDYVDPLESLLSISMGTPKIITELELLLEGRGSSAHAESMGEYFYASPDSDESMLGHLKDSAPILYDSLDFSNLLKNWEVIYPAIFIICLRVWNLRETGFAEHLAVDAVSGLEAMSTLRRESKNKKNKELSITVGIAAKIFEPEMQERVRGVLGILQKPTSKEQMLLLLEPFERLFIDLIPNKDDWVKYLLNARNDAAHGLPNKNTFDLEKFNVAIHAAHWLLTLHILNLMNLFNTDHEFLDVVNRSPIWKEVCALANSVH